MKKIVLAFFAALLLSSAVIDVALAHGGRTDKNGCHMDRKAGTRHCH